MYSKAASLKGHRGVGGKRPTHEGGDLILRGRRLRGRMGFEGYKRGKGSVQL